MMPEIKIFLKITTAFLFFASTVAISFFVPEYRDLFWFALSSAMYFLFLGPSEWLDLPTWVDWILIGIGTLALLIGVFVALP